MGRLPRAAEGGMVYHVLNRANARMRILDAESDYAAFEKVLVEAHERLPMRTLSYCLMPSHWHLVLWPRQDGELSEFMWWLTVTHAQRWHAAHGTAGTGHLYQGRFKSFPVQSDEHYLAVCRYVERNALRARLVERAEAWRWGSLWRRTNNVRAPLLSDWPLPEPRNWRKQVNAPQTEAELAAIRRSVKRGSPLGSEAWVQTTAGTLGLASTLRPRGRPKVQPEA